MAGRSLRVRQTKFPASNGYLTWSVCADNFCRAQEEAGGVNRVAGWYCYICASIPGITMEINLITKFANLAPSYAEV